MKNDWKALAIVVAVIAAGFMLVVCSRADAGQNLDRPLTDLSGAAVSDRGTDGKDVPVTLATLCINALLGNYPDEQALPGVEKLTRFNLALRISDKRGDVSLTASESALIVKLVAKAYGPLIVGRISQALDPESVK